jgi:hypothetical protein
MAVLKVRRARRLDARTRALSRTRIGDGVMKARAGQNAVSLAGTGHLLRKLNCVYEL